MFVQSELRPPQTPPPPLLDNRFLGGLILVITVVLLAALSFFADQAVFVPFAPTYAITQTAQAKITPTHDGSSPFSPPIRPPREFPTLTPVPGEQVNADQG